MRNNILKKVQDQGLSIIKLHEKLNEYNIKHEYIDRKAERVKIAKEEAEKANENLYIAENIYLFDLQILIKENGKEISLIQNPFSYGITRNLIEAYNFKDQPVVLEYEMAAELINRKKLNDYIIAANDKNVKEPVNIKELLQLLKLLSKKEEENNA